MQEQPNNLLVASQYGAAGSSTRVRIYDWLDHFELQNVERFEYRGQASNAPGALLRDLRSALRAELQRLRLPNVASGKTVFLSRELSPLSQGGTERALLERAERGIYDFDDALYAPPPGLIGRIYSRQKVWGQSVSTADIVIAGSEILAEEAAKRNRNVVMIPSCVEHTAYRVKKDFIREGTPRAVWIGSPATERYLQIAAAGLLAANRATGLRLKVISRGNADLGALTPISDRVDWTFDGFAEELADADFGIMPLPDDTWTRGKCAYKLLQYAAAGLPVIGSAVGANIDAINKLGGHAVAHHDHWSSPLIDHSMADTAALSALGKRARQGVIEHFSYLAWKSQWEKTVLGA